MNVYFAKSKKRYAEDGVQIGIVRHLRMKGFLCTSQGAGLIKSMRTQLTANRLGYLKGSPDVIVWIRGGTLNIECKAPKEMKCSEKTGKLIVANSGGRQSDTQKEFEEQITKIPGHHYIVAKDVQDVSRYIEANGIQPA